MKRLVPLLLVLALGTVPVSAMLNAPGDYAQIATRVRAGEEPWRSAWAKLDAAAQAARSRAPQPVEHYWDLAGHAKPDDSGHRDRLMNDAGDAYTLALHWAVGGDAASAAAAWRVIDAWASTLRTVDLKEDGILSIAYGWPALIWAAEVLRATGAAAPPGAEARLDRCVRDVVLPVVWRPVVLNNWNSWTICCAMSAALWLRDEALFREAVGMARTSIPMYIKADGRAVEITRDGGDLWHSQMGVGPLVAVAEMAWHRGVDLYSWGDERLRLGTEYLAPFVNRREMAAWPGSKVPEAMGPWYFYEIAAHHYVGRQGRPMPHALRVIAEVTRPSGFQRLGWDTLTHAAPLPSAPSPSTP